MRRIFIKAKLADKLVIDGSDGFHLSRVMRAKLGDHIVVADDVGQVRIRNYWFWHWRRRRWRTGQSTGG